MNLAESSIVSDEAKAIELVEWRRWPVAKPGLRYCKSRKETAAGRKTIVMTLVDRGGDAVGVIVPDTKKETQEPSQNQSWIVQRPP